MFVAGKIRAREDELKRLQYQAWLTATLTGFSKPPPFEDLFRKPGQRDAPEKMEAIARQFASRGWGHFEPPPSS